MQLYQKIASLLEARKSTALGTVVKGDSTELGKKILFSLRELHLNQLDNRTADKIFSTSTIFARGEPGLFNLEDEQPNQLFIQPFMPRPRLIILGGGHIGAALSKMAAFLDFFVAVVDDRPAFANYSHHPHAQQVICEPFDRALDQLNLGPRDFVVIVTRGHKHDRLCLEKVLQQGTAYTGMIGSRRRVHILFKELQTQGFREEVLNEVYAPIGIDIGAETENEIALSILAEVTQVQKQQNIKNTVQYEVLEALMQLERDGERAALATVIQTKGSTPRDEGSQLLIYPDGRLAGTIGGGCSEADVRRKALTVLAQKNPDIYTVKLDSDTAAEEGMACGGRMEIFLEPVGQTIE